MATGVNGSAWAFATQHVGMGNSSGSGGVTVLHLEQEADTALAPDTRQMAATFSSVKVGDCLCPSINKSKWNDTGSTKKKGVLKNNGLKQ